MSTGCVFRVRPEKNGISPEEINFVMRKILNPASKIQKSTKPTKSPLLWRFFRDSERRVLGEAPVLLSFVCRFAGLLEDAAFLDDLDFSCFSGIGASIKSKMIVVKRVRSGFRGFRFITILKCRTW